MMLAVVNLRHTIPSVEDKDARERTRRLDLLALRKHLDKVREWEGEITKWEAALSDQTRDWEHEHTKRLLTIARRGLGISQKQVATKLELLGLRDHKEDLERQLAALDE